MPGPTPGSATLQVAYATGGATAIDTYPITIVGCDVDIVVPPPEVMARGSTCPVEAQATPQAAPSNGP